VSSPIVVLMSMTLASPTKALAPISTGPPSADSTAPCMMQLPAPMVTSPLRTALGAT